MGYTLRAWRAEGKRGGEGKGEEEDREGGERRACMNTSVCMCVPLYLCAHCINVHACMCALVNVYMCVCMHVYTFMSIYITVRACVCACL